MPAVLSGNSYGKFEKVTRRVKPKSGGQPGTPAPRQPGSQAASGFRSFAFLDQGKGVADSIEND
jgi:hypothetical protein